MCKCSCENNTILIVPRKRLISGNTKSCGCLAREARKIPNSGQFTSTVDPNDIIGKRFGKLIVESIDSQRGRNYYYKCKCDCGNYVYKRRSSLLQSIDPPSCGCYRYDKVKNDIIGKKFNNLTVLSFDHEEYRNDNSGRKIYYFKCRCDCGNECIIDKHDIVNNMVKSCGCLHTSMMGMSNTGFYRSYKSMKSRCYEVKEGTNTYEHYKGKGIVVCDRWVDPINGFKNFKDDMYDSYLEHVKLHGEDNTTIERINVNGNYDPNNCAWATNKEQANNKTSNYYVTYNGETLTLMQCVEKYGDCRINYHTVKHRLYAGWDLDRALHELPNANNVIQPITFINKL